MADGTKVVRCWDVSRYPAHALYVGENWRGERPFREGLEWTRDSYNTAFNVFALESVTPGLTPFDAWGLFLYEDFFRTGAGEHPVIDYTDPGTTLSVETVENELSEPLFPPLP